MERLFKTELISWDCLFECCIKYMKFVPNMLKIIEPAVKTMSFAIIAHAEYFLVK